MKKYVISIFLIAALFSSCNENMPLIACLTCGDNSMDDDLEPQIKRILLEEFTGVECIGCPAGSTEIEGMLSFYDTLLVAVSIHAGSLSDPYPESQYDFRTTEGAELMNFLGLPDGLPSAVINRKLHPDEADLQLVSVASWPGIVGTQTDEMASISMELEKVYDANDRILTLKVIGQAQEIIDEEVRLTILISESNIVDAQLTPQSSPDRDPNYVHNHVLRKALTASDGDVLVASMLSGEKFEETYTFTIPQEWIPENCEVIAFTHLSESSKEIIQVISEHLTE